ncbi:MAG: hypothetical protein ACRBBP_00730, partial [Bdellovibrionales bacterium]
MNLLRFSLLLTFISCYAFAGLDVAREAAFQRAADRYSNTTTGPTPPPNNTCPTAPPPPPSVPSSTSERVESVDLRVSEDNVRIEDEIYWNTNDLDEDQTLTISQAQKTWQELRSSGLNYGNSIHKNIYNEITSEDHDHTIIVSSSVTAVEDELNGDSFRANHRFESKFEDTKILYVGNIQFDDYFHNIDSTISIVNTQDFDPCLLEPGAAATLKYSQDELFAQGRLDFNINCMITKSLHGEIGASFIFTSQNGEIIRKIVLNGELTLKVSEALTLKYSAEYINGSDPIDNQTFESFSSNSNRRRGAFNIDQFYFTKRDLDEGRLHKFSLLHTKNTGKCSRTNALSLGHIRDTFSEGPVFYVSQSRGCTSIDPETGKEVLRTIGISFSNFYLYNESPAPMLNFNHSIQTETGSTFFGVSAAHITPDILTGEKQTVLEFDFNKEEVKPNGSRSERALKVVYSQNDSYIVAEQIVVTPIIDDEARLKLQTPQGTRCGTTPAPLVRITDPDLCQKINCLELGAGLTFTLEGGVFVTVRGKTIADIWGRDFELEIIAGLPLSGLGENKSWGQSFSGNTSPFIDFSLTPKDCDPFRGELCMELNGRIE